MTTGTPKTLVKALENGLTRFGIPRSDVVASSVSGEVRDFLAQHFTTAQLENPNCEAVIAALWKKITKSEEL